MTRHKEDARAAAYGYAALFRGEITPAALSAGIRLHTYVENQLAYLTALAKSGGKKRG